MDVNRYRLRTNLKRKYIPCKKSVLFIFPTISYKLTVIEMIGMGIHGGVYREKGTHKTLRVEKWTICLIIKIFIFHQTCNILVAAGNSFSLRGWLY